MPKNDDLRQLLVSKWRANASGPFFKLQQTPAMVAEALPGDYLDIIREFGGKEGFLGTEYFRLYQLDELLDLNISYDVPSLFPECLIFASNGGGEAYAFKCGAATVLSVPFIPLMSEFAEVVASSFTEFVECLAATGDSPAFNPESFGKEVHEINPIVLGGSPTDMDNKVLVPPVQHSELCRFWNQTYRRLLADQGKPNS